MLADLESAGRLNGVQSEFLKKFAYREFNSFESLLPVAASIDHKHMEAWGRIINNLGGIGEADTDLHRFDALLVFIKYSKKFLDLEVDV